VGTLALLINSELPAYLTYHCRSTAQPCCLSDSSLAPTSTRRPSCSHRRHANVLDPSHLPHPRPRPFPVFSSPLASRIATIPLLGIGAAPGPRTATADARRATGPLLPRPPLATSRTPIAPPPPATRASAPVRARVAPSPPSPTTPPHPFPLLLSPSLLTRRRNGVR